jgi:hypothetical protein
VFIPTLPEVKYVPPVPDGVMEIPPLRLETEIEFPVILKLPTVTPAVAKILDEVVIPFGIDIAELSLVLIAFPPVSVILLFNSMEPLPEAGFNSIFPPPVVFKIKFWVSDADTTTELEVSV